MPPKPRVQRSKLLGRAQDLVGKALSDYRNDRGQDRADKVAPALEEAFNILVTLRSKYKR